MGNDLIFGLGGNDSLDGGPGNDVVFGGNGRDQLFYTATPGLSQRDFYSGGRGRDTLVLEIPQSIADDAAFQRELAIAEVLLRFGLTWLYRFDTLSLTIRSIETIEVVVLGDDNTPPVLTPLAFEISEDAAAFSADLLAGASDPDDDPLNLAGLPAQATTADGRVLTSGTDFTIAGSTLALTASGLAVFNSLDEAASDSAVFAYEVSDGEASVAQTLTLTVTGANDNPTVAEPVSALASEEDAPFSVDLLTGSSDVDAGDTLSVAGLTLVSGDATGVSLNGDMLDVDPSAYAALEDGMSEVIVYSYEVADDNGGSVAQTATITITGVSSEPDTQAPTINLALATDTGSGGADLRTNTPDLVGAASDNIGIQAALFLAAGLMEETGDILSALAPDGSFEIDEALLASLIGRPVGDGTYSLSIFAEDAAGNRSDPATLIYTLDRTAPAVETGPSGTLTEAPVALDVVFSEPVDALSILPGDIGLVGGTTGAVAVTSVVQAAPDTLQFTLATALPNDGFTLNLPSGIADTAGNELSSADPVIFTVAAPTRIVAVSPADGTDLVNLDREITVEFDRPIDGATLTPATFSVVAGDGAVPGSLRLSDNGQIATFLLEEGTLLPASSELQIIVDGNALLDASGDPVDADMEGFGGGLLVSDFQTVSLTPIPGTDLEGFIFDSNNRGPNGEDLPLAGVIVTVVGLPGVQAVTDENGRFFLEDLPVPDVYLHFDASPVTAETGFRYGTIVKPAHTVAGQTSTMTTPDGAPFNIFFAAIPDGDAVPLVPGQPTEAGLGAFGLQNLQESFPGIDVSEWEKIKVTIPPDALFFDDGSLASDVTVTAFEPDRIPAPAPPGYDPIVVFTVVADGAVNVDGKAQVEFPNLDGLAPGETRPILSFDHDAGEWVETGVAVVSEDGERLVSEGDTGVNTLGWKFVARQPIVRHERSYEFDDANEINRRLRDEAFRDLENAERATVLQAGATLVSAIETPIPDELFGQGVAVEALSAQLRTLGRIAGEQNPNISDATYAGAGIIGSTPTPAAVGADTGGALNDAANLASNLFDLMGSAGEYLGYDQAIRDNAGNGDIFGPRTQEGIRNGTLGADRGSIDAAFPSSDPSFAPLAFALAIEPTGDPIVDLAIEILNDFAATSLDAVRLQFASTAQALAGAVRLGGMTADGDLQAAGLGGVAVFDALAERIADLQPDFDGALEAASDAFIAAATSISDDVAGGGDPTEGADAFEAAQAAYFEAVVAASEAFFASVEAIEEDLAAAIDDAEPALRNGIIGFLDQATVYIDTLLDYLGVLEDFETVKSEFVAAVDAGETDLTAFEAPLIAAADGFDAFLASLQGAGFQSLGDWEAVLVNQGAAAFGAFETLAAPLFTAPNDVYAQAILEDGSVLRRKLGPDETFDIAIPEDTSFTVRFFDPATNLFSSDPVTVGGRNTSGVSIINEVLTLDSDGDGIPDLGEEVVGSDKDNPDSDGDGILDGADLAQGGIDDDRPGPTGLIGGLDTQGEATDVVVLAEAINPAARKAYIATGSFGLAIADVSDSRAPSLLGEIDLAGDVNRIAVDATRDVVYAAAGAAGVTFVDVSIPNAPSAITTIPVFGGATAVALLDGFLLVGGLNRVTVLDGTTGAGLANLSVQGALDDIHVANGIAYALVTSEDGDNVFLKTFDFDGSDLSEVGSVQVLDTSYSAFVEPAPLQLFVEDGVAYVPTGLEVTSIAPTRPDERGGYRTVDVSDPANPQVISDIDNIASATGNFQTVSAGSGLGLVAAGSFGVGVFDTGDPQNTFDPITFFDTPGDVRGVASAGGLAYAADGPEGLKILNLVSPATDSEAPEVTIGAPGADSDGTTPGVQVVEGTRVGLATDADDDTLITDIRLRIDGQTVATDLSAPFDLGFVAPSVTAGGTIEVSALATDISGKTTISNTLTFEIVSDSEAPTVLELTPGPGAPLAPGPQTFSVVFSEAIDPTTVVRGDLRLVPDGGGPARLPQSLQIAEFSASQQVARFSFVSLPEGEYTLTFDLDGITDLAGNLAAGDDIAQAVSVVGAGSGGFDTNWIGTQTGSWSDPANWSAGEVPGPSDDVGVPLGSGIDALVTEDVGSVESITTSGEGVLAVQPASNVTVLRTGSLDNGGNIQVANGRVDVLGPIENDGMLTVSGRGQIVASGNIANTGTIVMPTAGTEFAQIRTDAPLVELSGGGTLDFQSDAGTGDSVLQGSVGIVSSFQEIDETLANIDNLITGSGKVGPGFVFRNDAAGEVVADAGDTLQLAAGIVENAGLIKAEIGGVIQFDSEQFFGGNPFAFRGVSLVDNAGGTIWADGGRVGLGDSFIRGGTLLTSSPAGSFGSMTISGGTLSGVESPVFASANITNFSRSFLQGEIDLENFMSIFVGNSGRLDENGDFVPENDGAVALSETTTLGGNGQINLQRSGLAQSLGLDAYLTTEIDEEILDANDEFVVATTGHTLVLDGGNVVGSGTVGTSENDDYGLDNPALAPRLGIDVQTGSRIEAWTDGEALTLNNVNLTLASGADLRASNSAILEIVDSNVLNLGDISIDGSYAEVRQDFELGSFADDFVNQGGIALFNGGELFAAIPITNEGTIFIGDQSIATFGDTVFGGSSGSIFVRDGATASFEFGTDNLIDTSNGDAGILTQDSFSMTGGFLNFRSGDTLELLDFSSEDAFVSDVDTTSFSGAAFVTVDDGFGSEVTFQFFQPSSGPRYDENSFFIDEGDNGGLLLTTDLLV